MFSWGNGPALGLFESDAPCLVPTRICTFENEFVIDLSVGDTHCLALTKSNLFVCLFVCFLSLVDIYLFVCLFLLIYLFICLFVNSFIGLLICLLVVVYRARGVRMG